MFSIRNGHGAVLVLALTQCLVFASTDNAKNGTEDSQSAEVIGQYLKLPWMVGLDRLVDTSESTDAKKVRTFMRAVLAGETWATQILDHVWEDFSDMEERRVRHIRKYYGKMAGGCTTNDADNDYDNGHCTASTAHADRLESIASEESKEFSVAEVSTIVVFSVLGMLLVVCTILDFVKRNSSDMSSATVDTLSKFSLYRNALAVLNTKSNADAMHAIHGLRCLCSFTVMFGHRFAFLSILLNKQILLLDFVKHKNTVFAVYFEMATYAVDTFCVIGGFLQAYMFLKLKRSGLQFTVLTMYLYRYLRLTPCIAVLMLFVLVFSDRFGSGPMWDAITTNTVDPCRENWWLNLLHLQNLVTPDRICMVHSWYLGLDMQLFWLSPLILYPLDKSPKFGLKVLSLSLVVAVFTPAIVLAAQGYSNIFLRLDVYFADVVNNFSFYYTATYNRACPYLVGILLGYDVATRKRHLTKTNVALGWMVTGLLILFCTWLNNLVYTSGYVGDRHLEIPAAFVLRPFWSIAIAWFVYACTQGYGGFVTKFLSLPIFLPLSRLSYCIYLVHIVIQAITISSFNESMDPSLISYMVNGVIGDVVLSTVVAFVFSLFIERPTIVLTKILLDGRGRKPTVVTTVKETYNELNSAIEKHSLSKLD